MAKKNEDNGVTLTAMETALFGAALAVVRGVLKKDIHSVLVGRSVFKLVRKSIGEKAFTELRDVLGDALIPMALAEQVTNTVSPQTIDSTIDSITDVDQKMIEELRRRYNRSS